MKEITEIAKSFLYLPIEETSFPFIASHPFTNSWVVFLNAEKQLVDLHEEKYLIEWQKEMEQQIEKASINKLFLLLNKAYYLTFLKYISNYLNPTELGEIFRDFWSSIEMNNMDTNISTNQIISLIKKADKRALMEKEDYEVFEKLPEEVTLYRGVTSKNLKNKKAISWSTSETVARWFANRFNDVKKELWQISVPKEAILCYMNTRNEEEILVNTKDYPIKIRRTKLKD